MWLLEILNFLGPSFQGWAVPGVCSLNGPKVGYLQGGEGCAEGLGNAEWSDLMRVGRPLVVRDKAGHGKREGWAPGQSLHVYTCPRPPKYWGYAHCNTDHTPPLPCEAGDKTQGAKTIIAGGLIMVSSLVVLYIDSALGEMC